jgi:pimeloyl-ACP methyl ester carboxylesterase
MITDSYIKTPTQFIEVAGTQYAYREVGDAALPPLVVLTHFRGNLDTWDPTLMDGLAKTRRVIAIDNTGISRSEGTTPDNVADMARDAVAVIRALGLETIDLLGFSLGGFVAQQVVLDYPELVRYLILVGTGPQGGQDFARFTPGVQAVSMRRHPVPEDLVYLFFAHTDRSRTLGEAYLERLGGRTSDNEPEVSAQATDAQLAAIGAWGTAPDDDRDRYATLAGIRQPTLVVNGIDDRLVPTVNSYTLARHIPNAQLILYPDSGHGSQFQYPERFVADVNTFFDEAGKT